MNNSASENVFTHYGIKGVKIVLWKPMGQNYLDWFWIQKFMWQSGEQRKDCVRVRPGKVSPSFNGWIKDQDAQPPDTGAMNPSRLSVVFSEEEKIHSIASFEICLFFFYLTKAIQCLSNLIIMLPPATSFYCEPSIVSHNQRVRNIKHKFSR